MNELKTFFESNEFIHFSVKALSVIVIFFLVIFVVFIIYNKTQKRKRYEMSKPESGETRNGKIYCNLTDPVFRTFRAKDPDSIIEDHISVELESDLDSSIGIKYYAISRNGRFLIILNGSEYWVEPNDYFSAYNVHVRRKEEDSK